MCADEVYASPSPAAFCLDQPLFSLQHARAFVLGVQFNAADAVTKPTFIKMAIVSRLSKKSCATCSPPYSCFPSTPLQRSAALAPAPSFVLNVTFNARGSLASAVVAEDTSKSPTSLRRSRSSCTRPCQPLPLPFRPLLPTPFFSYKLVSIGLCSNLNGQIMTDLMVAPPQPGDVSYPLYNQEVTGIFSSLKRRATKVSPCHAPSLLCFSLLCELNNAAACRCSQFHEERVVHQPRRRNVRAPRACTHAAHPPVSTIQPRNMRAITS